MKKIIKFIMTYKDADGKHPSIIIEDKTKFKVFRRILEITNKKNIHRVKYIK